MAGLKKFYSRIFPASKYQVKKLAEELQREKEELKAERSELSRTVSEVKKVLKSVMDNSSELLREVKCIEDSRLKEIKDIAYKSEKNAYHALLQSQEAVWAHIWHDSIKNTEWLQNVAFSPGRWAVGYQCLYVLYRVLEEVHPDKILEMGLGQSTRLLGSYAARYPEVNHDVVEHDGEWISFFLKDAPDLKNTNIEKLDLITDRFEDDERVIMYKDFKARFSDRKYDLICVDSPFGGKAKKYARIDILKILPDCLEDSFVILVDDYNRAGEKEMVKKLETLLEEAGIKFAKEIYSGEKQLAVITSENWSFLCSL